MEIHICSITEYDIETRMPTIENPNSSTFYLVPTEDGISPDLFIEWVYVNGAWEMFGSVKIDLSGYLTDVTIGGTSVVSNGVAEIPIGGNNNLGVAKYNSSLGVTIVPQTGVVSLVNPTNSEIKNGASSKGVLVTKQHESTFYGLAKAAGHDEKDSELPLGQYTDEAKASIQNMLDVPSKSDIPDVPVDDVQINGTSIVSDGVANVPIMDVDARTIGVATVDRVFGTSIYGKRIIISKASSAQIKNPNVSGGYYCPIVPYNQHESVFYGLAKAASDTTQSDSSNVVGQYTDNAKDSIQNMLGITPLIAPHESDPFESAHVIGELFIINGKLYRALTALTAGEYVNEGMNVEVVSVAGVLDDTYVKNTDYATSNKAGIVKTDAWYGTGLVVSNGVLYIATASDAYIKEGHNLRTPIVPRNQHQSVFYGLAKAAGDTTQASSSNAVGTYTDEAKSAIKQMLSIADNYDSFIVDVEGTDPTITGQPSYRYNCSEVLSLTVTPPETGTIDFRFTSGSSPTVLTLPSTVKMPEWWVEVEANTIYEMCITDGVYCGVMSWAM